MLARAVYFELCLSLCTSLYNTFALVSQCLETKSGSLSSFEERNRELSDLAIGLVPQPRTSAPSASLHTASVRGFEGVLDIEMTTPTL